MPLFTTCDPLFTLGEDLEQRGVKILETIGWMDLWVEPDRVLFGVLKAAKFFEHYLERTGLFEELLECERDVVKVFFWDKLEEHSDMRHPAREAPVVLRAQRLDGFPDGLWWNKRDRRFEGGWDLREGRARLCACLNLTEEPIVIG